MPYEVTVDHERGLVASVWRGAIDETVATDYIETVWGDARVSDYDELVDFRPVTEMNLGTDALQRLVTRSRAVANPSARARSVLVASEALVFGLSRMYVSMRDYDGAHQREWQVMTDYDRAVAWLERRAGAAPD